MSGYISIGTIGTTIEKSIIHIQHPGGLFEMSVIRNSKSFREQSIYDVLVFSIVSGSDVEPQC